MRKQHTNITVAAITATLSPLAMDLHVFAADADVSSFTNFGQTVVNILITLAGIIAVAFFVIGGIKYSSSSGNIERHDQAKKTMTHAALGLVFVLAAYAVLNIVTNIAKASFGS